MATVASRGEGISDLLDRIEQFRAAQQATGDWTARRVRRARQEVEGLVLARLQAELALDPAAGLDALAEAVSRGELDAYTAADQVRRAAADRGVRRGGTAGATAYGRKVRPELWVPFGG